VIKPLTLPFLALFFPSSIASFSVLILSFSALTSANSLHFAPNLAFAAFKASLLVEVILTHSFHLLIVLFSFVTSSSNLSTTSFPGYASINLIV
jgi:hypothetical protein